MKLSASSLIASASVLVLPLIAGAQTGEIKSSTLGELLRSIIDFINSTLIPFIWAIAFIVFIYGVFQYFIAGGANEEKRDQGKQLVVWGIIAFFVMSSVWGIVNLFKGTFQFGNENTPDYPTFKIEE